MENALKAYVADAGGDDSEIYYVCFLAAGNVIFRHEPVGFYKNALVPLKAANSYDEASADEKLDIVSAINRLHKKVERAEFKLDDVKIDPQSAETPPEWLFLDDYEEDFLILNTKSGNLFKVEDFCGCPMITSKGPNFNQEELKAAIRFYKEKINS